MFFSGILIDADVGHVADCFSSLPGAAECFKQQLGTCLIIVFQVLEKPAEYFMHLMAGHILAFTETDCNDFFDLGLYRHACRCDFTKFGG